MFMLIKRKREKNIVTRHVNLFSDFIVVFAFPSKFYPNRLIRYLNGLTRKQIVKT